MAFGGLQVLALESRHAEAMARLIEANGGRPFVAPSLRETPAADEKLLPFAERLLAGAFDMMVFLTGAGTRLLQQRVTVHYGPTRLPAALRGLTVVARGSKTVAALREMGAPIAIAVPEPNTWREVLAATEGRPERRVAIQEYGVSNQALLRGLRERGAEVTPVRVYQWELPEDATRLEEAVRRLAAGAFDVALFTTSVQIAHLLEMAARFGLEVAVRRGLGRAMTASIGPTTTEALEEHGVHPDLETTQHKMGMFVAEAAARAGEIVRGVRG